MAEICCTIVENPEQQVSQIKSIYVVDLLLITCLSVLNEAVIAGPGLVNSHKVTEVNRFVERLRKSP